MARITTKQHLNDLRHKTVAELLGDNENFRAELFALKFQAAMGSLEKTHRISQLKKEIARIELILGEKRQAGEKVERVVKGDYSKAVAAADKAGKAIRKKHLDKFAALSQGGLSPAEPELKLEEAPLAAEAPKTVPKTRRKVKEGNQ